MMTFLPEMQVSKARVFLRLAGTGKPKRFLKLLDFGQKKAGVCLLF